MISVPRPFYLEPEQYHFVSALANYLELLATKPLNDTAIGYKMIIHNISAGSEYHYNLL